MTEETFQPSLDALKERLHAHPGLYYKDIKDSVVSYRVQSSEIDRR
jgi:hypothetical protein